ncbi:MAG: GGDEF domain-containing protein [Myxococcota bacterium]
MDSLLPQVATRDSQPLLSTEDETTDIVTTIEVPTESSRQDRLTLVALIGQHGEPMIPIDGEVAVFGRGRDADVRLIDSGLSRRHVRFFRMEGAWWVEDLQSRNGTWVNGEAVKTPRPLRDGDRIQIGKGLVFRASFHDEAEHAATKRMVDSAVRDPLTRVYNRRHLDDRLAQELAFAVRHRTPMSLLLVDVDHFKQVNDNFGHLAGDAVLRVMGRLLKRIVRTEDLVARYGGEEFAVVARGIDPRNAFILAERIRKTLASTSIPIGESSLHITVSIGIATYRESHPYEEVSALIAAADEGLYRAKEQGRNQSCGDE